MKIPVRLFWFRRDLRLDDNHGLFQALAAGEAVGLFVFDKNILDLLADQKDKRVDFIHQTITELHHRLAKQGARLDVRYGRPESIWPQLLEEYQVLEVYANEDYEPYARTRDETLGHLLKSKGIAFHLFKDQVIHAPYEIESGSGKPYAVYTPFSKVWLKKLHEEHPAAFPSESQKGWALLEPLNIPTLSSMGFAASDLKIPSKVVPDALIQDYEATRNHPAQDATSRLGIHLRFGTISPRALVKKASPLSETFTKELAWREFFMHILWHHPKVVEQPYRTAYANIPWRNAPEEFHRWCSGTTGYPIVDAGMRQLQETGFMHNRVRMVAASFLVKHLLIDWRLGEAWFARWLLDFDLASNNGNWQWVAGCGCDAAPYFRVFNPQTQAEKFDPNAGYIRKWVPEFDALHYPQPMVEHRFARQRAISTYKNSLERA